MAGKEHSSLFHKLKATKRIPSAPGTAMRVLELCRRDDVELQEIANLLMADSALSARLLRFANSRVGGMTREVTTVRDAVYLLGLRTVKLNALGFSLAMPELTPRCPEFSLQNFAAESFATAVAARRLATCFQADREEAFTVGLLANIGKIALAYGVPEEFASVLSEAPTGPSLLKKEREVLGVDHIGIGIQLLEDWGLPQLVTQAVAGSRDPEQADPEVRSLARTVNAAARLAPLFSSSSPPEASLQMDARSIVEQELNLDEEAWTEIAEDILADYAEMADVFDTKLDSQATVINLYAEAQEQTARVGIVPRLAQAQTLEAGEDPHRTTTDGLTGVANRARFDEKLQDAIEGARRGHGDFALIMLDIDHFKQFNDTHGQSIGDLVLKRVAQTTKNLLRETDFLARYDGERFTILVSEADRKGACIVASRVRKRLEDLRICQRDDVYRVTVSIGLVMTTDYRVLPSAERLIADADAQRQLSKKAGRNTWSYRGRTASQVGKQSVTAAR